MTDLATVRTGLATRLATISGLRAHATWPDQINIPCAIVVPVEGVYEEALGGAPTWTFEVILFAFALQNSNRVGQEKLDPYLARTGAQSIRAAIKGDRTLGGIVSTLDVPRFKEYGVLEFWGTEYAGVKLDVQVWE